MGCRKLIDNVLTGVKHAREQFIFVVVVAFADDA